MGHNPGDSANKKSVSMEEKNLTKSDKFWASYEKLELMGPVEQYLVNYSSYVEQCNQSYNLVGTLKYERNYMLLLIGWD